MELFTYDEEKTKSIIDKALFKAGVSLEKNIPTSEQYNDLIPVAKGKMSNEYYAFLKEKYGWKWIKDNVFGGSLGEMNAYELDKNADFEHSKEPVIQIKHQYMEKEDQSLTARPSNSRIGISLENKGLGENYRFRHDGLSHIFLMYAKGVIQQITAEQLSLIHLELYGRILPMETCAKLVDQINKDKTMQLHTAFTHQVGDSLIEKNALSYLNSKAIQEGWSEEKLEREAQALRLVAKKLENRIGDTLGRSWVHEDSKESKDTALKKTFNFISRSLDKMITGTVKDIADVDVVSRTKIKIE